MKETDLVCVAELIRLGAKTARTFADSDSNGAGQLSRTIGNGQLSHVEDLSLRIEGLADELLRVAKRLETAAYGNG